MSEENPPQEEHVEDENEQINEELDNLFNPLDFDQMQSDVQSLPKKTNYRRRYLDPKVLWEKCQEYFNKCDEEGTVYTVPELALHLGFVSRQAIFLYEKRNDNCGKVIKAAKLKIEGQRNRQVVEGQGYMAGRIFDLKVNFGYDDQKNAASNDQPSTQINVQNNNYSLPPQPQTLEEWTQWYQSQMKSTEPQQKIEPPPSDEDSDGSTIDISPSVREGLEDD